MELSEHADRIGPGLGIHVHLAHLCVGKPVDDEIVDGQFPLAVASRHLHQLGLCAVALLTLDVPICALGQHGHIAGQQTKAAIDRLIISGNYEEADTLTYLALKSVLIVEPQRDGRLRRIIPNQPITLVRYQKRYAHTLARGCVVVVCTLDHMTSAI